LVSFFSSQRFCQEIVEDYLLLIGVAFIFVTLLSYDISNSEFSSQSSSYFVGHRRDLLASQVFEEEAGGSE
jgi:hypothetical protein